MSEPSAKGVKGETCSDQVARVPSLSFLWSKEMIQADVKLDTLGYFCPMPIIMTLKKIKELTLGQVLEVVSDDEGIKKDMPAWCDTTGHQMVGLEEEQTKSGTIYKAFVKKTK
jgi:tRNA 2-thiouridine synthesizing protein A